MNKQFFLLILFLFSHFYASEQRKRSGCVLEGDAKRVCRNAINQHLPTCFLPPEDPLSSDDEVDILGNDQPQSNFGLSVSPEDPGSVDLEQADRVELSFLLLTCNHIVSYDRSVDYPNRCLRYHQENKCPKSQALCNFIVTCKRFLSRHIQCPFCDKHDVLFDSKSYVLHFNKEACLPIAKRNGKFCLANSSHTYGNNSDVVTLIQVFNLPSS